MWRTLTLNLERCVVYARTQDEVLATSVAQQVSALTTFLDQTPKTLAFKMRAAVGDRVRWYENPEEVER
jgi:hypothetical protein